MTGVRTSCQTQHCHAARGLACTTKFNSLPRTVRLTPARLLQCSRSQKAVRHRQHGLLVPQCSGMTQSVPVNIELAPPPPCSAVNTRQPACSDASCNMCLQTNAILPVQPLVVCCMSDCSSRAQVVCQSSMLDAMLNPHTTTRPLSTLKKGISKVFGSQTGNTANDGGGEAPRDIVPI